MMEETRKRNRPLKKGVSRNEKAAAPTSSTANPKGIREQVSGVWNQPQNRGCLVASNRDLQNHSGIPHMAGVLQWMDVSSWGKPGCEDKKHGFQTVQCAGRNTQSFAGNKQWDSQDLMGRDQRTVQHGWHCARCLLWTWSRRGRRRSLHSKAGTRFMIIGTGTHWELETPWYLQME